MFHETRLPGTLANCKDLHNSMYYRSLYNWREFLELGKWNIRIHLRAQGRNESGEYGVLMSTHPPHALLQEASKCGNHSSDSGWKSEFTELIAVIPQFLKELCVFAFTSLTPFLGAMT